MGRFSSKHHPCPDGPSGSGTLKNTRAQVCQEFDFRVVWKFFLVSTVVLVLAAGSARAIELAKQRSDQLKLKRKRTK
jgi:hypothetical protein